MGECRDETGRTLEAFAARRHELERTVAVWVPGDPTADPPVGRVLAVRVAGLITPGEGTIVDVANAEELPEPAPGDTWLFTVPEWGAYELRDEVRDVLRTSRARELNAVVWGPEPPEYLLELVDVRASPDRVTRLRVEPYSRGVYEEPLDGLVSSECK